jgi:hypothetical protein
VLTIVSLFTPGRWPTTVIDQLSSANGNLKIVAWCPESVNFNSIWLDQKVAKAE